MEPKLATHVLVRGLLAGDIGIGAERFCSRSAVPVGLDGLVVGETGAVVGEDKEKALLNVSNDLRVRPSQRETTRPSASPWAVLGLIAVPRL